jgi:hypothetical protein
LLDCELIQKFPGVTGVGARVIVTPFRIMLRLSAAAEIEAQNPEVRCKPGRQIMKILTVTGQAWKANNDLAATAILTIIKR